MDTNQFAQAVKQKYPQYASIPNDQLTQKVIQKYPQYQSLLQQQAPQQQMGQQMPQQQAMPQQQPMQQQQMPQQQQQGFNPVMNPDTLRQVYKAFPQLLEQRLASQLNTGTDPYKQSEIALNNAKTQYYGQRQTPQQKSEYTDYGVSPKGTGLVLDKFSGKVVDTGTKLAPQKQGNSDAESYREQARQDKLEKEYSDRVSKVVGSRSGQLGAQDAKVNQAVHIRTLVNQYYNPQTKSYDIPEAQAGEMVVGLANLVSGGNVANVETLRSITPKTAQGDMQHLVAYWTGKPVTYNSQAMYKNLIDSIDRQGNQAEKLRDKYMNGLKVLKPAGLNQESADSIAKAQFTTSYNDFLNESPDKSSGGSSAQAYSDPQKEARYQAWKKSQGL